MIEKNIKIKNKIRVLEALSIRNHETLHNLNVQVSIAFFKEALLNFEHKEFLSCIQTLNKAIKYNPFEGLFFSFKSFILGVFLKEVDEALKEIEKALTLNPHSKHDITLKKTFLRYQSKKNFCSIYI